jgi:hypothetical protein
MEDNFEVQLVPEITSGIVVGVNVGRNQAVVLGPEAAAAASAAVSLSSSLSTCAEEQSIDEFKMIAIDHLNKKNNNNTSYLKDASGDGGVLKGGLKGGEGPFRTTLTALSRSTTRDRYHPKGAGGRGEIYDGIGGRSRRSSTRSGLSGNFNGVGDADDCHEIGMSISSFPKQVSLQPPSSYVSVQEIQVKREDVKFELMNIRLTIYGLSGIVCERDVGKKKRFSGGGGRNNNTSTTIVEYDTRARVTNMNSSTASSISSLDLASWKNEKSSAGQLQGGQTMSTVPTTAVVSCEKNAVGSQSSVHTYLPSMPLNHPTSMFSNKANFSASWPLEQMSILDATENTESNKDLSSFQIIRCMQSSGFTSGTPGVVAGTSFLTQHVELQINLSRGTDIFPIGSARVAFGGDEEQETVMHVPIQAVKTTTKKSPRFGKLSMNKKKQRDSFESDPTLKWSLDDNATLKVGIQVIPQKTLEFGEEMETKRQEDELRQLLYQDDLATLLLRIGSDTFAEPIEKLQLKKSIHDQHGTPNVELKTSTLASFLCGALPSLCGTAEMVPEPVQIPSVVGGMQLPSIVSSVSESTDGFTEHCCDED